MMAKITLPVFSDLGPAFDACSPMVMLLMGFVAVLIVDLAARGAKGLAPLITFIFGALSLYVSVQLWQGQSETGLFFNGTLVMDRFTYLAIVFTNLSLMLVAALAPTHFQKLAGPDGTPYMLLILSTLGMQVMVAAGDLTVLFIGLEILSIPLYVLCGLLNNRKSAESGTKYLLVGAFATGVLLFGMALFYGATGTTKLDFTTVHSMPLLLAGLAFILSAFAFKVGAVPNHQWVPDVYQGAPTAVTAFMSVSVKAAAFLAMLRVFYGLQAGEALSADAVSKLYMAIAALAVLSMIIGNLQALAQTNLKRMLAFSSVAHAGYLLVGLLAALKVVGGEASSGLILYLFSYLAMTFGAFAVLHVLESPESPDLELDHIKGLFYQQPLPALVMTVSMLSLAGIPITFGFFGKMWLFAGAVDAKLYVLVLLAILGSLFSLGYYLRVILYMSMKEPTLDTPDTAPHTLGLWVVLLTGLATLLLGPFHHEVLDFSAKSIQSLFTP